MAEKKKKDKKKRDFNQLAFDIVQQATDEDRPKDPTQESSNKNPHAVALGRLGGLKGGKARAKRLTPKERSEIAKMAANARWKKSKE